MFQLLKKFTVQYAIGAGIIALLYGGLFGAPAGVIALLFAAIIFPLAIAFRIAWTSFETPLKSEAETYEYDNKDWVQCNDLDDVN